ncbi:hypothetical protein FH972_022704 [Carpinus fangiana]|uniref:Maintenance of telomere capping protein 1 n=1 Tax=Carpinus fangiana TaxID=176857 RepID=A0A5N6KTJ7_9ROSI|nr:hypothetical protein FH972_022704 [Carpinus fangiana]
MAQKKASKAAPTNDELDKMFEGIGDDDAAGAAATQGASKPDPSTNEDEDDPLAELKNLASAPRQLSSRPSTPRVASSTATSVTGRGKPTPPSTTSGRSSEDKTADEPQDLAAKSASSSSSQQAPAGSWWGGLSNLSALATSAIKQAEATVKEIRTNEEALKWAEQARSNYGGALKGLDGLRSKALPTFTSLLHTLAPPISQHERLQIHITHDLVGYPSLDPMIYATFSRVMAQVEGGDLLVVQRGSESTHRRDSDAAYRGSGLAGWNDGPWWRQNDTKRNLGAVKGLNEGTKLARVSAETYANEFYTARGGLEEAAKQATANLSESNPVRRSDIFMAIQAIEYTAPADHFGGAAGNPNSKTEGDSIVIDEPTKPDELVSFAIFLHDPIHSITFSSLTQPLPKQWADWLDASLAEHEQDDSSDTTALPKEIVEMINNGGVDPREWVAEWFEEALSLGVGITAQRYVARRMGVGEGGLGRGKSRRHEEAVESGGGEAARAI